MPRTLLPLARPALALGLWLLVTPAAVAQVVAYDPFNQNTTAQLNGTASSGGGAVWPNSPQTWGPAFGNGGSVVSGSLSYGTLNTAGNMVQMSGFPGSGGNNGSVRALGSSRGGAGNDIWLSFLIKADTHGAEVLALYNSGNPVATFGTPTAGNASFGMSLLVPVTGTTAVTQTLATQADGTTTHLIAAHLQLGAGGATNTVTMYLDPDVASLGTGAAPTGGLTTTYSTALNFDFNQIVLGNFSQVSSAAFFDEIRIGTTWAAVSPVPEPAGLLLAGVAGLAAVRRMRRRPA